MKYDARLRALDELLRDVGRYCHLDAPIEYVVISKRRFQHFIHRNRLMAELFNPSKAEVKVSIKLEVDGREVELIKDPALEGRLEVIARRNQRDTMLTYKEVATILNHIDALLEEEVDWETPFPRGSC